MIATHHGKPGGFKAPHPMFTGPEFRQTIRAVRLLDYIDGFINYYERAKGYKPQAIRLRPEQFATLGVLPGKRRNGVRLEVT